ncbi:ArsR family transcriptional regulator [Enterococcus faecium]|uniref:ArsR family transcriptional regulator n=1 Tax=Enterococcus faecium TaxID=1352 RepID=UPI0023B2C993|nr:winged helix-turn-helix domain-containing protein [Enterococcus faecium]
MTVQDDILMLIKEYFPYQAMTASQITKLKQLSQNTVSHHLNRLAEENLLEKIRGKPTKFRIKKYKENGRMPLKKLSVSWAQCQQ